jgi:hypothetical protein
MHIHSKEFTTVQPHASCIHGGGDYSANQAAVASSCSNKYSVYTCFSSFETLIVVFQDKNWRNRRSQKLEKMELLNLQSSLQSEIQAKQAINEELSKTRSELIAAQK